MYNLKLWSQYCLTFHMATTSYISMPVAILSLARWYFILGRSFYIFCTRWRLRPRRREPLQPGTDSTPFRPLTVTDFRLTASPHHSKTVSCALTRLAHGSRSTRSSGLRHYCMPCGVTFRLLLDTLASGLSRRREGCFEKVSHTATFTANGFLQRMSSGELVHRQSGIQHHVGLPVSAQAIHVLLDSEQQSWSGSEA
ncbi:hypothetical protein GGR57DRAFT_236516 [Xylariaceae sp. FL1272]|nr:hypothetical protein GGR57DRAFT_236516 [Xylariaceae sp. FL1272]